VNISSLAGVNTVPGIAAYSASKAGLSHFTGVLRNELKGLPIRTTLVQVGPVATEMMDNLRTHAPMVRSEQRIKRLGLIRELGADELAEAVVDAVRRNRRHVRLPKRDLLFPMLSEAPRRITEALLVGVNSQRR
jgi:short-subunit dehydrogenase